MGSYYRTHPEYRARVRELQVARRKHNYTIIADAKRPGCADCGEMDPVVLDLDHVRGVKRGNIARLASGNTQVLIEELAKCEPRCANCHRRATAQRGQYSAGRTRRTISG